MFCSGLLGADEGPLSTEPEIVFISPLGGQQGTTQKIEIHGNILDNASAVVFETEGITTHIENIEAVSECCFAISVEAATESINFLVRASVEIGSTVPPGNHWLRVVTPRGITNRILFRVNADSVIEETDQPHSTPEQAQALSTLITELDERGLFETTTVVVMGEFGRTPDINSQAGRDHWCHCWSLMLGGGGIQGGRVVGASDERGGYVADRQVTVGDHFATVYKALGIDWSKSYTGRDGRPLYIANSIGNKQGHPVNELF